MHQLEAYRQEHQSSVSVPERELLDFVAAVTDLFGSEQSVFLREIWLDELASMDTMPEPASPDWTLVTVAAWGRLAQTLIGLSPLVR